MPKISKSRHVPNTFKSDCRREDWTMLSEQGNTDKTSTSYDPNEPTRGTFSLLVHVSSSDASKFKQRPKLNCQALYAR